MESIIERKSFDFAVRIVKLYDFLKNRKKEFIISKQLLRSGTSIGANVAEAQRAQSTADFVSKMKIALKEANETKYWLRLLSETGFLDRKQSDSILSDCSEIEKILVSILNTSKSKI